MGLFYCNLQYLVPNVAVEQGGARNTGGQGQEAGTRAHGNSFSQWPLRCWPTLDMILGTTYVDEEGGQACSLLYSVFVPRSCRELLICGSTFK